MKRKVLVLVSALTVLAVTALVSITALDKDNMENETVSALGAGYVSDALARVYTSDTLKNTADVDLGAENLAAGAGYTVDPIIFTLGSKEEAGTVVSQANDFSYSSKEGIYDIDGYLRNQRARFYKGEKESEGSSSAESDASSVTSFSLIQKADTNGDSFATATAIEEDDKISGTLETSDDIDYFVFTADRTRNYYFNSIGDTDVAVVLYNASAGVLGSNDDVPNPDQTGLYYYNCGLSYPMTEGVTYYFALKSNVGDRGDYAVSLTTYDPKMICNISDSNLQAFYKKYYAIKDGSKVPMSVMLMTDYIAVKNLKNTTNMTMAQNLETLYVYNSPSITNLSVFDNYQYLEYAIFNNTAVTNFPNLAGWGSVKYFELSNSKVSELPDWSSSSNLLKVNVTGNYIDFADGSVSAINEAAMEAEGIQVVRSNQKSLSKVTLTSSNTKPQAYEDIVLTAAATSTVVDIEDGAEYKFEASYKGGDWTTISDWGTDTVTWYADGVGYWRIRASARLGGNEEDSGISTITRLTVSNPEPIDTGRVNLTGISKSTIRSGESITLYMDINTDDIPERYELEYRLLYSKNGGSWGSVADYDWDDYPEAGITEITLTPPTSAVDVKYQYAVQIRVKGIATASLYDGSNSVTVKAYSVMPLESVTFTGIGDDENMQIVPSEGIMLSASAENMAGYNETPTYSFSYRLQGTKNWTDISTEFTKKGSVVFVPPAEGIYYFRVQAMSSGRTTVDAAEYDYQGYTLYSKAEPAKAAYNLTSGKKDYKNGEMITLTMDVAQNSKGDDLEYQLQYSTDNKIYTELEGYQGLVMSLGESYDAKIKVPVLPTVAKDTIYYIKVLIRTVGRASEADAYAVTQVEMMVSYPVEAGEVEMVSVGNDNEQQQIGAGVVLYSTYRKDTEYRFAYQTFGTDKWKYVSTAWSDSRTISFKPAVSGQYKFRVEARTDGRTTIDTVSEETDYYGLYTGTLGVRTAEISSDTEALVNDLDGNDLDITFSMEGNGTNAYESRITYSTNGRSYRVLPGYDWDSAGVGAIEDATDTITLPSVKVDTHYYVRIEARTVGHAKTDMYDTCEVDVYVIDPLTSIDSFTSDAVDGLAILAQTTDMLQLTAEANDEATYKFYYRLEDTTKWKAIANKYVTGNQAFFRPKTEGEYEFMVQASAKGRKTKNADVTAELGEVISIYFAAEPAESVTLAVSDADRDYVIKTDTQMHLAVSAEGNEAGLEYRILYSANAGKSYKALSDWRFLTDAGTYAGTVNCTLPTASKDTNYYIVAQVRSTGRVKPDAVSDPESIWMLTEEREVTTELMIDGEAYEYTDTITANIAISEPVSGDVEYQLQYSTNGKAWNKLGAHTWREYDDSGAGSIDVTLNLAELSGDNTIYIRLNARMHDSTKIEDYAEDSFELYNIAPVETVELSASASGDEYITLTAAADDGGFGNVIEYQYSYAMAGKSKPTWQPITSWITAEEVTFMPSNSGDYIFRVRARSQGRSDVDATAEATNEDTGFYLKSIEDSVALAPDTEAGDTPSPSPEASASAEPSISPEASASTEPSASPSENPTGAAPEISSLDFAIQYVLGKGTDIGEFVENVVLADDMMSVITADDAPLVIIQFGEDEYAVITGYMLDEAGDLIALNLIGINGEIILGGTEDITNAWYYTPAEPETSPSIAPVPSAEAEASATPDSTPETSVSAPEASDGASDSLF